MRASFVPKRTTTGTACGNPQLSHARLPLEPVLRAANTLAMKVGARVNHIKHMLQRGRPAVEQKALRPSARGLWQ